ncbi:toll/interleukin-1 receptor domain-containing protein [Streptomyces sp. NPDC006385]|uniref:toll/interleukin-1 receptor domain-containing protein n=1 Tax=Streptomyces sp. NPDC006385 TaxID=3156761 RepID=UPI0033BE466B
MRYFVSYARRDNSTERLREIGAFLSCTASDVYIDDLEPHLSGADRVQVVVDALALADVFVAVESSNYLKSEWTRWEFETAFRMGIEVVALRSTSTLVRAADLDWPWPNYSLTGGAAHPQ